MLYVGTSGWQYGHWRETFYPKGVAQSAWLGHYSGRFQTVEVNNSFYRLPDASAFERWRDQTPDGFLFTVKASRFLTHFRRLREPEQPVGLFLDRARHLGSKLGAVLLQLPPNFPADPQRLAHALDQFPPTVRVSVEFRDQSWYTPEVHDVLEAHGAALCLADRHGLVTPEWRTANWGFVRFHEGGDSPPPCYTERQLGQWAERIDQLWGAEQDVFCYFNNDARACAIRDAIRFARLASEAGLKPSRAG